jgi:hypothetical protein
MDKRIGWNLDSTEHAMFNWPRPIPACSKARSQFNRASVTVPDRAYKLSDQVLHMRAPTRRIVFQASVVFLILLWATAIAPEPPARIAISPGELLRVSRLAASLSSTCA